MASIGRTLGSRENKPPAPNEPRFAGDERKDKLYEPKHKQKLIRVLTVVAYVIFVSMAAILLSLYYTFVWNPKDQVIRKTKIDKPECPRSPSPDSLTIPPISNGKNVKRQIKSHKYSLQLKITKTCNKININRCKIDLHCKFQIDIYITQNYNSSIETCFNCRKYIVAFFSIKNKFRKFSKP